MAKMSRSNKYMTLDDVVVTYRKSDDTLRIVSSDVDLSGEGINLTVSKGSKTDILLRDLFNEKSGRNISNSPNYEQTGYKSYYAKSDREGNSSSILIGEVATTHTEFKDAEPLRINLTDLDTLLVTGYSGAGKSVFLNQTLSDLQAGDKRTHVLFFHEKRGNYENTDNLFATDDETVFISKLHDIATLVSRGLYFNVVIMIDSFYFEAHENVRVAFQQQEMTAISAALLKIRTADIGNNVSFIYASQLPTAVPHFYNKLSILSLGRIPPSVTKDAFGQDSVAAQLPSGRGIGYFKDETVAPEGTVVRLYEAKPFK